MCNSNSGSSSNTFQPALAAAVTNNAGQQQRQKKPRPVKFGKLASPDKTLGPFGAYTNAFDQKTALGG